MFKDISSSQKLSLTWDGLTLPDVSSSSSGFVCFFIEFKASITFACDVVVTVVLDDGIVGTAVTFEMSPIDFDDVIESAVDLGGKMLRGIGVGRVSIAKNASSKNFPSLLARRIPSCNIITWLYILDF